MDGLSDNTNIMLFITFYEMCYREAYPDYNNIQVAVVKDEDHLSSAVILAK